MRGCKQALGVSSIIFKSWLSWLRLLYAFCYTFNTLTYLPCGGLSSHLLDFSQPPTQQKQKVGNSILFIVMRANSTLTSLEKHLSLLCKLGTYMGRAMLWGAQAYLGHGRPAAAFTRSMSPIVFTVCSKAIAALVLAPTTVISQDGISLSPDFYPMLFCCVLSWGGFSQDGHGCEKILFGVFGCF